jgi:hypothetical protein
MGLPGRRVICGEYGMSFAKYVFGDQQHELFSIGVM